MIFIFLNEYLYYFVYIYICACCVVETRVYWVQGSNGNGNHVSNSAQLHWSASVVDAEKTGDYTCVAMNDVDKDTFTIRIIVEC